MSACLTLGIIEFDQLVRMVMSMASISAAKLMCVEVILKPLFLI